VALLVESGPIIKSRIWSTFFPDPVVRFRDSSPAARAPCPSDIDRKYHGSNQDSSRYGKHELVLLSYPVCRLRMVCPSATICRTSPLRGSGESSGMWGMCQERDWLSVTVPSDGGRSTTRGVEQPFECTAPQQSA